MKYILILYIYYYVIHIIQILQEYTKYSLHIGHVSSHMGLGMEMFVVTVVYSHGFKLDQNGSSWIVVAL